MLIGFCYSCPGLRLGFLTVHLLEFFFGDELMSKGSEHVGRDHDGNATTCNHPKLYLKVTLRNDAYKFLFHQVKLPCVTPVISPKSSTLSGWKSPRNTHRSL